MKTHLVHLGYHHEGPVSLHHGTFPSLQWLSPMLQQLLHGHGSQFSMTSGKVFPDGVALGEIEAAKIFLKGLHCVIGVASFCGESVAAGRLTCLTLL